MIDCPDCQEPIQVIEHAGKWSGTVPEERRHDDAQLIRRLTSFPVLFAILGLLTLLGILSLMPGDAGQGERTASGRQSSQPEKPVPSVVGKGPSVAHDSTEHRFEDVQTPTARLEEIARLLEEFHSKHQRLPNGRLASEGNFEGPPNCSWIAELVWEMSEHQTAFSIEHPWSDPINDAFVRQRLQSFLNPQIAILVGEDRLPTTHFAGVAGVGEDAERLPVGHPRAGIFSPYRTTRLSEVSDGTSNTMLVVGVQEKLGSWARPGTATLRSFTQEPYVNGPDGLGTGEADSMSVLMADGSVRTISQATSPVIVRRMAAMADGLPLSLETPGDPLQMGLPENALETNEPKEGMADDPPIEPLLAADAPTIDIHRILAQRLISYRLETPTQLKTLLREFEELLGVPVDHSQLADESLQQELTLDLQDITIQQLLEAVAKQARLEIDVADHSIIFRPLR